MIPLDFIYFMFIEPSLHKHDSQKTGWIEVICGSMFSGKTEELIRRLNRARIAQQKVEIFKPKIDNRYHDENVVSHNQNSIRSTPIDFAQDILLRYDGCEVVGIDEAQFFDDEIVNVCLILANKGIRIIIAGLDMDYQGKPFGCMPALMAVAEFVTKVHAICMQCGGIASYSYRLNASQEKVLVGERDHYEARCRTCFNKGLSK